MDWTKKSTVIVKARQAIPFVKHNTIYCTRQTAAILGGPHCNAQCNLLHTIVLYNRRPTLQCTMQPIVYDSSSQSEAHIALHRQSTGARITSEPNGEKCGSRGRAIFTQARGRKPHIASPAL